MARAVEQTFLFADVSGFAALTEAHGDEDAADLVTTFVGEVRGLLPEGGAQLVKVIGDALMVRCENAPDALRLGVRIVEEVGGRHGFPLVRVGMHTGPAAERDGDWFGATVNLAARISGMAAGDEVLLTEATQKRAGEPDGITVRERGRRQLRNVAEPVLIYKAERDGERSQAGLPIDPVCRMAVDPEGAAGTLRHSGVEYHFCSLACAQRFAERPDRYAR